MDIEMKEEETPRKLVEPSPPVRKRLDFFLYDSNPSQRCNPISCAIMHSRCTNIVTWREVT